MKKYFIEGTEEELFFGDSIELDLTKNVKHGTIHHKETVTLSEDSLAWLLRTGIIEEREEEKEDDDDELLDFDCEPCETLEQLLTDFETLEERFDKLEASLNTLSECITVLKKEIDAVQNKKTAQPKKNK